MKSRKPGVVRKGRKPMQVSPDLPGNGTPKVNVVTKTPVMQNVTGPDENGVLFKNIVPTDCIISEVSMNVGSLNKENALVMVKASIADGSGVALSFMVKQGINLNEKEFSVVRGTMLEVSIKDHGNVIVKDVALSYVMNTVNKSDGGVNAVLNG